MKHFKLLFFLYAVFVTTSRTYAQQAVNVQDSLALVDVYDSNNGPGWLDNAEWKKGPVRKWDGVTVTDGRVTVLSLECNGITFLPASFGNLTNLKWLYLAGNQLHSLPESFGNLVNLSDLYLGGNQLRSIPESFGNLTNLRYLDLYYNQLSSLPASFGNLTNLINLTIADNQLHSFPEFFGNLVNLNYLYLSDNQLSSLPASLGNLTKLQYLILNDNQLSSLPESCGNLTNLKDLELGSNKLGSLPASFGNMKNLQLLYLDSNQLRSLPESFGNLVNLQYLNLYYNQLHSLPESFGNLKNLNSLSLSFNPLSSLPESFGNLTRLSGLGLGFDQLSSLPASFGKLKNLVSLSLKGNQFRSLPESFGNFVKLWILDLSFNQLTSLPASFSNLVNAHFDEEFHPNLSDNKFTFTALEWVARAFAFPNYAPQDTFKLVQKGNTLIASVGGTPKNNTFTWYRDNVLDTTIQADSTYTPTKAGTYRVKAHNAIATKLTLYSDTLHYVPSCTNCATTWYRDADGDGFGDPHVVKTSPTQPRGYVSNNLDCDDKDSKRGGPEVCDGIDNDCDGVIDNGFATKPFYSDFDGDGYGSPKRMKMACSAPPRYVSNDGDCNDDDSTVHPGAKELCDGKDNDCNGTIDDGLPQKAFYWDHDKDGYGFFRPIYACAAPRGYISVGGDFNDNNPTIHPGAIEHCDGIDEDCDGVIDNGFVQKRFYKDEDGDGWGGKSNRMAGCAPPGYVEQTGDCNDHDPNVHPGAGCNSGLTKIDASTGDNLEVVATTLHLSAVPNPSQHYFNLRIESGTDKPVQLRVVDALGRMLEGRQNIAPNTTITVGNNYRPGIYYAEVLQGAKTVYVKLVKTSQ